MWVDATEDPGQKSRNIKRVADWLKYGMGFKADGKAAVEWYQKAVNLGDKDAAKQIEKLRNANSEACFQVKATFSEFSTLAFARP